MNVYIMADIEGISGIYSKEQVLETGTRWAEGRRYMTDEINACADGLKAAGVEKVYVRDCHGRSSALEWDRISESVDCCICGNVGDVRYEGLEECDAVILLGYHAMAGTQGAILEHTFSSAKIQNMYLNDLKVGEIAVDAAIAGEHNKPVIMISGDDKACDEAHSILPDVLTARVKKGLSCEGGILLPPQKAHSLIYNKAMEAVKRIDAVKPFLVSSPVTLKMEMVERVNLPLISEKPYMKIIDGRTYCISADSVEQALLRVLN